LKFTEREAGFFKGIEGVLDRLKVEAT